MKIVYFIDHLRPDGTQRVLTQMIQGLGGRGHSQAVVCLNDSWDAGIVDSIQANGCPVRVVGKAALVSGVGLVKLIRWLRKERFERAVTLLFYADVLGRPLARASGVPRLVTYIQARNTNYSGWQRWLVRKTMPLADQVVVCTRFLGEYVVQAEGATVDQIRVIPHGISMNGSKAYKDSQALRSEFNIPASSPLVGSLGRLTRQKGYDVLLEALAQIALPDVHVLIAGSGEALPGLQAQAERLNLSERVHFAGYRQDAPDLLHALDVYVQPSRFEGMPNAVLEAMAAGCPIVASGVDGHCELIQDGVDGWLVPPEDSQSLAKALNAALSNPEDARWRGQAVRQKVQAEYSLERMTAAWCAVLGATMSTDHQLQNPELSIVIVNSDSTEHTLACLDSIFLHPPELPYEVILVDNCSAVSCLPVVAESYPEVRWFSAPQKQGFARNYNLGIRQAVGVFVLILNNDTVVLPGTIDRLVRALQFNPNYGVVGPQLRSRNWRVQSVCARKLPTPWDYLWWQFFTDPGLPTGRLLEYLRHRRVARRKSGSVACISGACMLVTRRALEQVGLLDEGYDFYYEDIEWCHRMQNQGYQVAYIAESRLFHLGDQSLSKVKEWAKRSEYLSAQRYFRQYYRINPAWQRALWLATLSGFALRAVAFRGWELLTGKPGYSREYQRLTRWIWSQSPARASAAALDPANSLQLKVEEGE